MNNHLSWFFLDHLRELAFQNGGALVITAEKIEVGDLVKWGLHSRYSFEEAVQDCYLAALRMEARKQVKGENNV